MSESSVRRLWLLGVWVTISLLLGGCGGDAAPGEVLVGAEAAVPVTSSPSLPGEVVAPVSDGEALEGFFEAVLDASTSTSSSVAPVSVAPVSEPVVTAPPVSEPAVTTVPAPTVPPVTEPQPVPAPPAGGSIEGIIYAAAAEFGVSGDFMLCVARRESGLNPGAVNVSSGALGLFQHLPQYWSARAASVGYGYDSWSDPTANARVSAWLLATSGPSHWASTTGGC